METQQATPVLEYSRRRSYKSEPTPEEAAAEAAEEAKNVSKLNEAVTWAVLSICLAAWAVIGLFLWIPRLLRAVVTFSVALVQSTITETTAEAAGQKLRSAANFYRRGFVGAVASIRPSTASDGAAARQGGEDAEGVGRDLLFRETVWALVVWYVLLWVTGVIRGTPVDVAVIPWADLWSVWVDAIWAVPQLFQG